MGGQKPHPSGPATGLNHNVRYKDRVFHLQTEDLGAQGVTTQLFLGGNVVASLRSASIGEDGTPSDGPTRRKRMEAQHKSMARTLLSGGHDALISQLVGGAVYEPGALADGVQAPALLVGGSVAANLPTPPPPVTQDRTLPRSGPATVPPPPSMPPGTARIHPLSDEVIVRHLLAEPEERD